MINIKANPQAILTLEEGQTVTIDGFELKTEIFGLNTTCNRKGDVYFTAKQRKPCTEEWMHDEDYGAMHLRVKRKDGHVGIAVDSRESWVEHILSGNYYIA